MLFVRLQRNVHLIQEHAQLSFAGQFALMYKNMSKTGKTVKRSGETTRMKRKVKVILTAAIFTFCTAIGGCKAVESKLEPVYEAILQDDSLQEEKNVQASENQEMSTKEDLYEKESASVEDKEKETVGFTAVPAGTEHRRGKVNTKSC